MSRLLCSVSLAIGLAIATISPLQGQVTFLPPTPYLSAADSPFDMSGLGTTFFFEDFEDGVFNYPPGVFPTRSVVNSPGPLTDSVDADDGMIDGSGMDGHTMMFDTFIINTSNPPQFDTGIDIDFDKQQLGFLPNAFGFVWTDGMNLSALYVYAYDEFGTSHALLLYPPLMDSSYSGETEEDLFIGFVSEVGIRAVSITNGVATNHFVNQFEMDHLQFGLLVPEPRIAIFSFYVFVAFLGMLRRSHLRFVKGAVDHVAQPPPHYLILRAIDACVAHCRSSRSSLVAC